jgi:hypothetical protein
MISLINHCCIGGRSEVIIICPDVTWNLGDMLGIQPTAIFFEMQLDCWVLVAECVWNPMNVHALDLGYQAGFKTWFADEFPSISGLSASSISFCRLPAHFTSKFSDMALSKNGVPKKSSGEFIHHYHHFPYIFKLTFNRYPPVSAIHWLNPCFS